jgi:FkbM family methyltransferase
MPQRKTRPSSLNRGWRHWRERLAGAPVIAWRLLRRPRHIRHHGISVEVNPAWGRQIVQTLYTGGYEAAELRVLRHTLRPEDRYLEIGAAIAVVTTAACQISGDRNVTAYEANPDLIPFARSTARRNGFELQIVNAVLSDADGTADFYVHEEYWASSLTPRADSRKITVPQRSFASTLDQLRPSYLLMDIEGGEVELLAAELPGFVRAACLEVHPHVVGKDLTDRLIKRLTDQGLIPQPELTAGDVMFFARSTPV